MIPAFLLAQQNFTSEGFDYLMNGSIIKVTDTTYTSVMGEWFYVALLVAVLMMTYMRFHNFGMVAFMGVLSIAVYTQFPDWAHNFVYAIVALSIGLLLFSIFGKRNSPFS